MSNFISDARKDERIQREISGHLAKLSVGGEPKTCFVAGDADCLTIGEIINACGYTTESLLGRRLVVSIEDET